MFLLKGGAIVPQFASKAEENYYERQASLTEFLTWYHQQELPEYENPL